MAHNLSITEGTFNQCDAILSKVRQEAAMVKSQVAASPAVSAQDLSSLKRIVEEVKQEVARVQAETDNKLNDDIAWNYLGHVRVDAKSDRRRHLAGR